MSATRPLPPRPSLEFDRKEAKALLRRLRAADPDTLARAHAQDPALDPSRSTLADAQRVIAREYGFTSWQRLVQYHAGIVRQRDSYPTLHRLEAYEQQARVMVKAHANQRAWAGRLLAAYVPRFYGMSVDEVYTHAVAEAEARLAIARSMSCPSWEVLVDRTRERRRERVPEHVFGVDPFQRANTAISNVDLGELQSVVHDHPELLRPTGSDRAMGATLLNAVFDWEMRRGRDAMRPVLEWLAGQGLDVQRELNMCWYNRRPKRADDVRALLTRGADPNWVADSGIPVLEHALLRWWSGDAIDALAEYVRPRHALWIAAGLGDVAGVRRFIDRAGKPTAAARLHRPPLDAVGSFSIPVLPDPSDEEILFEAFWVAVLNGRTAVMEYLLSRGLDVNCRAFGTPVVNVAVGNGWTAVVECLVRAGADLDIHEGNSNGTARDMAREMFRNGSHGPGYRRIVELCGLDADAILAERDATPLPTPAIAPQLQEVLDLAADDAAVHGATAVLPAHLLFGLFRAGGLPVLYFTSAKGLDRERFHASIDGRVRAGAQRSEHAVVPLHPTTQAMIEAATALAASRRRSQVNGLHVMYALTSEGGGTAARLLTEFGSSTPELLATLERVV
jgi:Clp amino terminal domain, pathogenicity island component